jgi:hypothetical protein
MTSFASTRLAVRSPLTARNHGTYRLPSRCSARCAGYSCGRDSVAALAFLIASRFDPPVDPLWFTGQPRHATQHEERNKTSSPIGFESERLRSDQASYSIRQSDGHRCLELTWLL